MNINIILDIYIFKHRCYIELCIIVFCKIDSLTYIFFTVLLFGIIVKHFYTNKYAIFSKLLVSKYPFIYIYIKKMHTKIIEKKSFLYWYIYIYVFIIIYLFHSILKFNTWYVLVINYIIYNNIYNILIFIIIYLL